MCCSAIVTVNETLLKGPQSRIRTVLRMKLPTLESTSLCALPIYLRMAKRRASASSASRAAVFPREPLSCGTGSYCMILPCCRVRGRTASAAPVRLDGPSLSLSSVLSLKMSGCFNPVLVAQSLCRGLLVNLLTIMPSCLRSWTL